ncbi:hypothetical protein JTE90_017469 [Oedothorax gibbosus]|uniref:Uncharacterized protein n=1 Tax=Oedothorax gibbosus TaxID=931172 RepID=A0AAV6TEP4_9ARAC|nr:hypothetical protein JTE90_017469 [Oedothorax gibbosus]
MEPFSSFSPSRGSHLSILLLHQNLHRGAQAGSRPHAHARHREPSYSLGVNLHEGSLCRSGPSYAARTQIGDDRLAVEPLRTPPEFPLAVVHCPGIVSPSFWSQRGALQTSATSTIGKRGGSPVRPAPRGNGDPDCGTDSAALYFHFAAGLIQDPLTRRRMLDFLGPWFQDGSGG